MKNTCTSTDDLFNSMEPIGIGAMTRIYQDKVRIIWYLKELFYTYKYGEKLKFRKILDNIKPYLDERLVNVFEEIYETSLWLDVRKVSKNL